MLQRLADAINANTRLVIFGPGRIDTNKSSNIAYTEKILSYLKEHNLPTIYISSIQTPAEARETARKYDAYHYGNFGKGVPLDQIHFQFDFDQGGKGPGGHLTAEGCQLVAKNMAPLIERILEEKNIH